LLNKTTAAPRKFPADYLHLSMGSGGSMPNRSVRIHRPLFTISIALYLMFSITASSLAQDKKVPQTNGVDNSKMGAYRALAQHIYAELQKGNLPAAAELSRVLERVWDKAEDYGGDTALSKKNRKLFDEIDKAMDQFLSPILEAKGKQLDLAKVKANYNTYLEKLKRAD
jgi:hypothetical protein